MAEASEKATVTCPHCGRPYPIEHEKIGKAGVFCDSCQRVFSTAPPGAREHRNAKAEEEHPTTTEGAREVRRKRSTKTIRKQAKWAFWLGLSSILSAGLPVRSIVVGMVLAVPPIVAGTVSIRLASEVRQQVIPSSRLRYWVGFSHGGKLLSYIGICTSVFVLALRIYLWMETNRTHEALLVQP